MVHVISKMANVMVVSSARLSVYVIESRNVCGAGFDDGGIGANGALQILYSERLKQ